MYEGEVDWMHRCYIGVRAVEVARSTWRKGLFEIAQRDIRNSSPHNPKKPSRAFWRGSCTPRVRGDMLATS
jgi:hypothetical protein